VSALKRRRLKVGLSASTKSTSSIRKRGRENHARRSWSEASQRECSASPVPQTSLLLAHILAVYRIFEVRTAIGRYADKDLGSRLRRKERPELLVIGHRPFLRAFGAAAKD
jgi:hypothetical protein